MAFPVASRSTGLMITDVIWNSDIVENLNSLLPAISNISTTGTQAALAIPTGRGNLTIFAHNNALLTIQGITAGYDGQELTIHAAGNARVDLVNQSVSASAPDRLLNFATSAPMSLSQGTSGGTAVYTYDVQSNCWRMKSYEQGVWITPTYAAGDFTASVGSWTVESGDLSTLGVRYRLSGRSLTVAWYIAGSTVVTGGGDLRIGNGQWGGFQIASFLETPFRGQDNGGTYTLTRLAQAAAGGTYISLYADATGAGWTAGTNNNTVIGTMTFEVL